MSSTLREVRLFVSSTFRDLEMERNRLAMDAFPRLRNECFIRGVAFTEIDLRWGITDDEAREYRVLQVCLEEVERCSHFPPFFIGVLGDRYGWIPDSSDWERAVDLEEMLPGFASRHKGRSITELEIQCGVLERQGMLGQSFFYFRSRAGDGDPQQEALKQRIRASGAHYREDYASPEELAEWVVADLTSAIDRQYPIASRPSRIGQIMAAQELHSKLLAAAYAVPGHLQDWLHAIETHSLCLFGESGCGKSTFLAALADEIGRSRPDTPVFTHFSGVGDSSTRFTLMACLFTWARERGLTQLEVPGGGTEMQVQLPILLDAIAAAGLVVIILDAIDQLDDGSNIDEWLPADLPAQVRLVVSTTNPVQAQTCLRRGWQERSLAPMDQNQAKEVVVSCLDRYRKRLPEAMLCRCVQHPMASVPLFLKVLSEELRLHGKHETLAAHLDDLLNCESVPALFGCMLKRIERDLGTGAIDVLIMVGLSRRGVSEPELRECLGLRTWDVRQVMLTASPYLGSHQGMVSAFHEGFRRALTSHPRAPQMKMQWCDYWHHSSAIQRRFDEYPHALLGLGAWERVSEWVFAEQTQAFAWESGNIDALAGWHARAAAQGDATPGKAAPEHSHWPLAALRGLRAFAYQIGDRDLEMTALMAQSLESGDPCSWYIDRSLLHYRRGQQSQAVDLAHQATARSVSPRERLDSAMNLIQMLAFGSNPVEALEICRQITVEGADTLEHDREAQAYLCQYTSFACHFLDLNAQSHAQSERAAELYGALDRRYDQGISWVNAGDGAWGSGRYGQADQLFRKAMYLAESCRLPHVEDIAKICLANLWMSQGRLDDAVALYREGISLAQRIGQEWDVLYGRIYLALTLGLSGKAHEGEAELAVQAEAGGYGYLADLARAYQLVLADGPDTSWCSLVRSPFPGPRAYALASGILQGQDVVPDLLAVVNSTEGIKGPSDFIRRALTGGA